MSLLYADLPEQPREVEPGGERRRIELAVVGVVAALGATIAGGGVVRDLARRRQRPEAFSVSPTTETALGFSGVERVVDQPTVPLVMLDQAPVVEFAPAAPEDEAAAAVDAVPDPAPLPAAGPAPRTIDPPGDPLVLSPITPTVPPTTAPPTTAPPTTTIPSDPPPDEPPPDEPPPDDPGPTDPPREIIQLAQSAGFAVTPAMAAVVADAGFDGWIERQLDPDSVPDPAVDEALTGFDLLDVDPEVIAGSGSESQALSQVRWAGFTRAYVGERQIHERVASAWREWFAVHGDPAALVGLEQIIRRHALDPYVDLLAAVLGTRAFREAFDVGPGATEADIGDSGLARAVLERFTLGPDAAFDEDQVRATASALAGDDVVGHLHGLIARPETAAHVGGAVGTALLGAGPATEGATTSFAATGGDIAQVVRETLLDAVGTADASRIRTGGGWLVAAARAVQARVEIGGPWDPTDPNSIAGMLRRLGAEPGTGISSDRTWESAAAISARWQVARRLTGGNGTTIVFDREPLRIEEPVEAGEFVDALTVAVGGHPPSEEERAGLLAYIGRDGNELIDSLGDETISDLAALVVGFPGFQRRDGGQS